MTKKLIKKGEQIILLEPLYYSEEFGGILTKKEADKEGYDYGRVPYFKRRTLFTATESGNLNNIDFEDEEERSFIVDAGYCPRKIKVIKTKKDGLKKKGGNKLNVR